MNQNKKMLYISILLGLVSSALIFHGAYSLGLKDGGGYIFIPCGQKLILDNLNRALFKNITFDTEEWCASPIVVIGKQTKNSQFYFNKN